MEPLEQPRPDPTRVRVGLAMVCAVVVAAVVLLFAIDDAFARAIMFAVALSALIRAGLLVRSLRREARTRDV